MMNERIKELQSQAFLQCKAFEDGSVIRTDEAFEKFAELIVAECATYLNVAVEVHNQNEQDVCDRAARAIKRYFGVNDGD